VTRSKTAIDDAGKKLNEEARAKINAVDAQRRKIREELDALAEEVRKPLTEWEKAEDQRIADKEAQINEISRSVLSRTANGGRHQGTMGPSET
jgi:colicin import membrane protein